MTDNLIPTDTKTAKVVVGLATQAIRKTAEALYSMNEFDRTGEFRIFDEASTIEKSRYLVVATDVFTKTSNDLKEKNNAEEVEAAPEGTEGAPGDTVAG